MQKKIILKFICILVFSAVPLVAQDLAIPHKQLKAFVINKNYKTAVELLNSMQKDNKEEFIVNNYDYLLARLSEKNGNFATAAANYQGVINRNSALKEHALWHLSSVAHSSGNLFLERLYLEELTNASENSLLLGAVNKRLARSNFESGNYDTVINLLEKTFSKESKTTSLINNAYSREDLSLMAKAYYQNKNTEKAREFFTRLIEEVPNEKQPDDYALEGVKGLDLLEVGADKLGKSVGSLSDEEHFKRASIYQFNRNFSLARLHYKAIANNHPDSEKRSLAVYQIGRGFAQERDYEEALKWFKKVQQEYPNNRLAASALYQIASAYANLDETQKAVSGYSKYIDENPKAKNLERAYLNIVDAYRDEKDYMNALKWASLTQDKFKGGKGEAVALFTKARIYISQKNWKNALQDLITLSEMKNLGGFRVAGGTNITEVEFLKAYILEKLQHFVDAIDAYLNIPDGRKSFYGGLATKRLRYLGEKEETSKIIEEKFKNLYSNTTQTVTNSNVEDVKTYAQKALRLTNDEKLRDKLVKKIAGIYKLLPDYKNIPAPIEIGFKRSQEGNEFHDFSKVPRETIARELLYLGIYDEGTPEMELVLRNSADSSKSFSELNTNTAYTLAQFYKRGDMANRAVGYIEPIWKKIPKDYEISLIPRKQLELLYPKPYEKALKKYSAANEVDPRLVLSIMRQESRFQANVKSVAAARGLMQFISTTADAMADEMEIENFKQDDLYNPPNAIKFGTFYMSKIFEDFPNQPEAVAASYNAGEDRMARWLKRSNTADSNQYVSEVVFTQTKDYVYKVMENYRIYMLIYDKNLKPIN